MSRENSENQKAGKVGQGGPVLRSRRDWLKRIGVAAGAATIGVGPAFAQGAGVSPAILSTGFIADPLPTRSCHASTIVETENGLMAAWFGGSEEGKLDVSIWLSAHRNGTWSEAVEVANGIYEKQRVQYPLWNPVLFRPKSGQLYLFYKEGPRPKNWWGMVKMSPDNGRTWTKARRIPGGNLGPIRCKPIEMADGTILCGSSTEDEGWRVHMEKTKDPMKGWESTGPLNSSLDFSAIQPTVLDWGKRGLQILCRTKQRVITESWSVNKGVTWSRMLATDLPNPSSGIDAVKLHDGRALLVYNHTRSGRGELHVAVTPDGKEWHAAAQLEKSPGEEFSYPAVIQTSDRLVHITYTWRREKIKHVVLDPSKLSTRPIVDGQWPW